MTALTKQARDRRDITPFAVPYYGWLDENGSMLTSGFQVFALPMVVYLYVVSSPMVAYFGLDTLRDIVSLRITMIKHSTGKTQTNSVQPATTRITFS